MTDETFSISSAAESLGIPVYTLRRWCDWHAAHLSSAASPGPGIERRLTAQDVEVLREVQRLRKQGYKTLPINDKLGNVTVIDVQAPVSPQDAPQAPQTALAVWNDLAQRVAAVEASQRDALRDEVAQLERRARLYFLAGAAVTLIVVVVVALILRL